MRKPIRYKTAQDISLLTNYGLAVCLQLSEQDAVKIYKLLIKIKHIVEPAIRQLKNRQEGTK